MIFGLLYFCVVFLCVNRSRSSFILYRIVKRHSRQSNVRRIWTCADNEFRCAFGMTVCLKSEIVEGYFQNGNIAFCHDVKTRRAAAPPVLYPMLLN